MFAGMSGGRNIDTILDEKFSSGLSVVPSERFEEELMKRIALENEFRKQDVKTHRFASTFIFAIMGFFTLVFGFAAYLLSRGTTGSEKYAGPAETFAKTVEATSLQVTSFLGISGAGQGVAVLLVILLSAMLYTVAERYVIKKGTGRGKGI